MGKGDNIVGKIYLREHSTLFRKRSQPNKEGEYSLLEDPIVEIAGLARIIVTILCRNKQRLLQQAWSKWVKNVNPPVVHDYTSDLKTILMRQLANDEMRSELEIEVLYKWAMQHADKDPTGVASILCFCKRKNVVVRALQLCRLERFHPGDGVIFQGQFPRPEDGHFTVISGRFEALQFPDNSIRILNVHEAVKTRSWMKVNTILKEALVLSEIMYPSGFGELATLTNTQRTASIRCALSFDEQRSDESLSLNSDNYGELLVVPKQSILECLEGRREGSGLSSKISEAIDFLRQSGLAQRISSQELITAAKAMIRRTFIKGEVIFCKGEPVESVFLVVSGDVVLDTLDDINKEGFVPFKNVNHDYCYHLSSGSILGDEGATGENAVFTSTALVISDFAVVFEATGFAVNFLFERLGLLRYSALMYSTRERYSMPLKSAENVNVYSNFNSLRKCIAAVRPFRETILKIEEKIEAKEEEKDTQLALTMRKRQMALKEALGHEDSQTGVHHHNKGGHSPTRGHGHSKGQNTSGDDTSHVKNGMKYYFDKAFQCHRRVLASRVTLHHAEEAIKESRKKANVALKRFTQESILFNQITRENMSDTGKCNAESAKEIELRNAERKMKSLIAQYRERTKKKEEEANVNLASANAAVQLFSSFVDNSSQDDDEEQKNQDQDQYVLSVDNILNEFELKNVKQLSRIVKYFAALDVKAKGGDSARDSLASRTSGSSLQNSLVSSDINSEILADMKLDESIQKRGETLIGTSSLENKSSVDIPPLDFRQETLQSRNSKSRASTANAKDNNKSRASTANSNNSNGNSNNTMRMTTANSLNDGTNNDAKAVSKSQTPADDAFAVKTKKDLNIQQKDPKFHRFDPPNTRRVVLFKKDNNIMFLEKEENGTNSKSLGNVLKFKDVLDVEIRKLSDTQQFFEILNSKTFERRKLNKHSYEWSTRCMKTSDNGINNNSAKAAMNSPSLVKPRPKQEKNGKSKVLPGGKSLSTSKKDGLVVFVEDGDGDGDGEDDESRNITAENNSFDDSTVEHDNYNARIGSGPDMSGIVGIVGEDSSIAEIITPLSGGAKGIHVEPLAPFCTSPAGSRLSNLGKDGTPSSQLSARGFFSNPIDPNTETKPSTANVSELGSRPATTGTVAFVEVDATTGLDEKKTDGEAHESQSVKTKKRLNMSTCAASLMVEVGTLATANPISDALTNFQATMYTDYKKRSLLEGRKRANQLSRFELPKIVPTPSSEFVAEMDLMKRKGAAAIYDTTANSTVNSNGIDKSTMLLLSCLHGNDRKKDDYEPADGSSRQSLLGNLISPSTNLKNYLVKTVKTADSMDNLNLKKQYDYMIYDSLVYSTEMKGKNTKMKYKEEAGYNDPNGAPNSAPGPLDDNNQRNADGSNNSSPKASPNRENSSVESINQWQQFSISTSVDLKKGPKIAFPVVYINKTSVPGVIPVDDKAITQVGGGGNRSRRFGGSQLLQLTKGVADEMPISGPSSYIDLYKNRMVKKSNDRKEIDIENAIK